MDIRIKHISEKFYNVSKKFADIPLEELQKQVNEDPSIIDNFIRDLEETLINNPNPYLKKRIEELKEVWYS